MATPLIHQHGEQDPSVAELPALRQILRGLEQNRLIEPPSKNDRKTGQALTAHYRAKALLRSGLLVPGAGADEFERLSMFYKDWRSRAVIGFCSKRTEHGFMSNWFEAKFTFEPCERLNRWLQLPFDSSQVFRTAEQAIMQVKASVFGDKKTFDLIADAYNQNLDDEHFILSEKTFLGSNVKWKNAEEYIKSLGKRVERFDENTWQAVVLLVAVSVVFEKFRKCPDLQSRLLATGNDILVEAADYDSQWGVLLDLPYAKDLNEWRGWNILGEALMITRHCLSSGDYIWQQKFFSTHLDCSIPFPEGLDDLRRDVTPRTNNAATCLWMSAMCLCCCVLFNNDVKHS